MADLGGEQVSTDTYAYTADQLIVVFFAVVIEGILLWRSTGHPEYYICVCSNYAEEINEKEIIK